MDDLTVTWNLDDPRLRNQAVKASIEAATTLLPPGAAGRFIELGIFAEDESVPLPVVALLWQASGGLTEEQTRSLCLGMERLSLVTLDRADGGTLSLHDVVRDYLRADLGVAGLACINGVLIDAIAASLLPAQPLAPTHPCAERAWWQMTDGYLLDHLIDHLLAAGRTSLAEAVAGDLRWVEYRRPRTRLRPAPPHPGTPRIPDPPALQGTPLPLRQQRRHRPSRSQRGRPRGCPLHRARPGLRDPARRHRPRNDRPASEQRRPPGKALGSQQVHVQAVTGEVPFGDSLVIARNIWDARRVSRILARETALLEQLNPIDAFLDEDDDPFDFDEDA